MCIMYLLLNIFFFFCFFCHRLKMRHSNVFVYFYIFYLFLEFSASTRFGWKKMKLSCENGNLDERFENQSAASRKVVMLTQTQIQTHTKSRRRTNLMNVTKKKNASISCTCYQSSGFSDLVLR